MKTSDPKYPDVHVRLSGEDGNAYMVLGRVAAELKRSGVPREDIDAFWSEGTSGDYDHVIQTCMKWVHVQ